MQCEKADNDGYNKQIYKPWGVVHEEHVYALGPFLLSKCVGKFWLIPTECHNGKLHTPPVTNIIDLVWWQVVHYNNCHQLV